MRRELKCVNRDRGQRNVDREIIVITCCWLIIWGKDVRLETRHNKKKKGRECSGYVQKYSGKGKRKNNSDRECERDDKVERENSI